MGTIQPLDDKRRKTMAKLARFASEIQKIPFDDTRRTKILETVANAVGYDCCSWISYYSGQWAEDKGSAEEILQILMEQGANDDVIAGVREAVAFFDGGVNALDEAYGSACTA